MEAPLVDSASEKPTIFIVDDDDGLRRAVARLIRSAGWNVEVFASAPEFLERPAYDGIGCLVLDVRMPGMTGLELHANLLARGDSLPVIFLTAHCDVPGAVKAMKKGAVDFLTKPADDTELLQAIRRGITRYTDDYARHRQLRHIGLLLSRLSPREREVLKLVIDGRLNKQVADELGISIKTVKVHRAHVMEKMEVKTLAALVRLCDRAETAIQEDCT